MVFVVIFVDFCSSPTQHCMAVPSSPLPPLSLLLLLPSPPPPLSFVVVAAAIVVYDNGNDGKKKKKKMLGMLDLFTEYNKMAQKKMMISFYQSCSSGFMLLICV